VRSRASCCLLLPAGTQAQAEIICYDSNNPELNPRLGSNGDHCITDTTLASPTSPALDPIVNYYANAPSQKFPRCQ